MAIDRAATEAAGKAAAFEIAILAKAPIAGFAKTRLIPLLGPQGAADLQRWLLQRTVALAVAADLGPVALWCAPDTTHPAWLACQTMGRVALHAQPAGDLGARMLAAASRDPTVFGTVIIGTDCPGLQPADLAAAAQALRDGHDVAITPADDGGYVLIAMRRAQPALFADIAWSTPAVMAQTRDRLQKAGLSWAEFAPKADLDLPADWLRLAPLLSALGCPGAARM